ADVNFRMPVQVSKNFLWDRQLNLTWNLLQSLSFSFASNTTARIEETVGAVNKRLFPDKYREWRDTVWSSIKSLGTPWNYNQTFTGTYRAPFNKIPVLDYLTGSLSYSSVYRWDKGATVDGLYLGNSIQNQTVWNADARLNFETLYNKSKYLQAINKRFAKNNSRTPARGNGRQAKDKEKKFERAVTLLPDTSTFIRHNLKTKKVKVSALDGNKVFKLNFKVVDDNSIEVLNRGDNNLKITVREDRKDSGKSFLKELGDYSLRFLMMPRSLSFKWRSSHSLNLPQFAPNVGDIFGQSGAYGPLSPGLDFAFGFYNEGYVQKAIDRGWLLTGDDMTSPALWNNGKEFNFELTLEPLRGLKVVLTSNLTDNRTRQIQFMYAGMPTTRSGSYTRTHVAIASAMRSFKAENGYQSDAFDKFLQYIPRVAERVTSQYMT
ncbi:MAG: cell surface protein SprA, partial [Muribaculaceae bacterium]|nr:cell surface protein SprA [Muribaculaceae bacterium]